MPSTDGLLTPEELEIAKRWLLDREAVRNCPICGYTEWSISNRLAYAPTYARGLITIGAGYPALIVVCSRCTFFRWHSAIAVGLVKADAQEAEDAKAKAGAASGS